MAPAVVELDALADAIGTTAEDHDLLTRRGVRFTGGLVRAVEIGREGLELGCTRVYPFVNGPDPQGMTTLPNRGLAGRDRRGKLAVAKAGPLEPQQPGGIDPTKSLSDELTALGFYLDELPEEPWIDLRDFMEVVDGPSAADRPKQVPHPAIARNGELLSQHSVVLALRDPAVNSIPVGVGKQEARTAELERTHALQERFLEGSTDGHRFPDRLHLRRQRAIGLRELLEIPARNLDDDVIDRRLERGWRDARDVVGDLVEVVAQRKLGCDLGDRKAGRFRCQRRRPRDTRVHLDDDHAPVLGVHRELDVRPSRLDSHPADDA